MALPPLRVNLSLPEPGAAAFDLPRAPAPSARIQEEAHVLLEQLLASATLQSDRDACLDHLQAITNSILFKTQMPAPPELATGPPALPPSELSPMRHAPAGAVAETRPAAASVPNASDRALFDAAGHLFMSQLRARPLFQRAAEEEEEMVEQLLASEPLFSAEEASRGRPATARTQGDEHYDPDEYEEDDGGSEGGSSAYEARRRLKRYQNLRERQRRQLLRQSGRSRGGQQQEEDAPSDRRRRLDPTDWPIGQAWPAEEEKDQLYFPGASPVAAERPRNTTASPTSSHKPPHVQQAQKLAALRSIFHQVAPTPRAGRPATASAQDLATAISHHYLLSELCGRDVIEEAAGTLAALGEDLTLELSPFLLFMGSLYTGKPRSRTPPPTGLSPPRHRSSEGWHSDFHRCDEEQDPFYGRSRSSSRSSLHALDLSNCPTAILGDVLAHGPLKHATAC